MATTTGIGGLGLTHGFADPIIVTLGKMTPMSDGYAAHPHAAAQWPSALITPALGALLRYAVGITLLMCLTNRPAVGIFGACETEHDADFEEIAATKLADPSLRFPPAVAEALKDLVKSNAKCLCHDRERKRLDLPSVLKALQEMLSATAGPADDAPPPPAASSESTAPSQPTPTTLVNKIGKDAAANPQEEAERRLQRHAVNGFNAFMLQLDRSYGAATPDLSEFEKVRRASNAATELTASLSRPTAPLALAARLLAPAATTARLAARPAAAAARVAQRGGAPRRAEMAPRRPEERRRVQRAAGADPDGDAAGRHRRVANTELVRSSYPRARRRGAASVRVLAITPAV